MGPLGATPIPDEATARPAPRTSPQRAAAPKVVHLITSLEDGGAQSMLHKLLAARPDLAHGAHVVVLTAGDERLGRRIAALGVPVTSLGMKRGRPSASALPRLVQLLRRERPGVLQTWLYHADLLGGVAGALLRIPVVWGIRHDALLPEDSRLTRLTRGACAALSRLVPAAIVCNSEASRRRHAALGYAADKLVVVPNGFDLARFRPDAEARRALRAELRVDEGTPLVGLVARFHPHKDHATFFAAAARVRAAVPGAELVLCGEDVTPENRALTALVERAGLGGGVHLLGKRDDVERVTAALDVACLTSRTESFPNVLGEAMACGVPCVATDCGDVREIAGGLAAVVPPGDAVAIADAVLAALRLDARERARRGEAARARVRAAYDIATVAEQFERIHLAALR